MLQVITVLRAWIIIAALTFIQKTNLDTFEFSELMLIDIA